MLKRFGQDEFVPDVSGNPQVTTANVPQDGKLPVVEVDPTEQPRGTEPQQNSWQHFVSFKGQPLSQNPALAGVSLENNTAIKPQISGKQGNIRSMFLRDFNKAWAEADKNQPPELEQADIFAIAAIEARKELERFLPVNSTVTLEPRQFMQLEDQIRQVAQETVNETRTAASKEKTPLNQATFKLTIQRTVRQRLGIQSQNPALRTDDDRAQSTTATQQRPPSTLARICHHFRIHLGMGETLSHSNNT